MNMKENNKYRYNGYFGTQYQNEPVLYYRYFAFGDRVPILSVVKTGKSQHCTHCYIRKYHSDCRFSVW